MIVILLVIATAAFLLAGVVTANIVLTYVSLGIATLALVLLFGDLLRRRRNADSAGEPDECGDAETDVAPTGSGADPAAASTATAEPTDSMTTDPEEATADAAPSVKAPSKELVPEDAASGNAAASGNTVSEDANSGAGVSDQVPSTAIDSFPLRNGDPPAPQDGCGSAERGLENEVVLVVPGRKRFHRDDCRLLGSRNTEELTVDEAREEGFTPCTTCTAESLIPAR